MSLIPNIGDYVILQEVKDFLKIKDDKDDSELDNLVEDANQEIQLQLTPFANALPLKSEYLLGARKAGLFYVVSCWKSRINNDTAASAFMKKFDSKMKTIKDAIKSQPLGKPRTRVAALSLDYDTESTPLFSQVIR